MTRLASLSAYMFYLRKLHSWNLFCCVDWLHWQ